MKSMKALFAGAGVAATFVFAGPATAQTSWSDVYLGATIGQSKFKDGCGGFGDCDDEDTAWRIFGGYQFNRYFAAELGYHDLGEASASAGASEGTAWEILGVASYPFTNQFSVYGKLGGYRGDLEGPGGDESNTDLTYGVGLRYDFTPKVGVRGEWQRYSELGGGNVVETDVDVLSVGILYRFQ